MFNDDAIQIATEAMDTIPADLRPSTLVNRDRASVALRALVDRGYRIERFDMRAASEVAVGSVVRLADGGLALRSTVAEGMVFGHPRPISWGEVDESVDVVWAPPA